MVYGRAPWTFAFRPRKKGSAREVRDWLKDNLPKEEGRGTGCRGMADPETRNVYKTFAKKLAEKKWVAPAWPTEYGGLGSR